MNIDDAFRLTEEIKELRTYTNRTVDELHKVEGEKAELWSELLKINALRPPCRTCGGTQEVVVSQPGMGETIHCHLICPDCVDGKVPWEKLVAEHNMLWDDALWEKLYHTDAGVHAVIYALRRAT